MHLWMNLTRTKPDLEAAIIASRYGVLQGVINPFYKPEEIRSKLPGQYTYLETVAEKNPMAIGEIVQSKIDVISPLRFSSFGFVFNAKDTNIAQFVQWKKNFPCQVGAYFDESKWASPGFFIMVNSLFETGIDYIFLSSTILTEFLEYIMRIHDRQLYKTRVIAESEAKDADEILGSNVNGLLLKDYEYVELFGKI
jgi:hypothetical protein